MPARHTAVTTSTHCVREKERRGRERSIGELNSGSHNEEGSHGPFFKAGQPLEHC